MTQFMKKKEKKRSRGTIGIFLILILVGTMIGCSANAEEKMGAETVKRSQEMDVGSQDSGDNVRKPTDQPKQNEEFLVLINKTNPVDETYKPEDLTSIRYFAGDRSKEGRFMRAEAAGQFEALVEGAAQQGYELVMTTAYRSFGFQKTLYTNYVNRYGEAEADTFSAKPGQSEHQSGLAVDVSGPVVQYALTDQFGNTAEGKWMAAHAHEYGFILRFPLGKEKITGYQYEPWHLRYVGQPAADEMDKQGLTLEEYLEL